MANEIVFLLVVALGATIVALYFGMNWLRRRDVEMPEILYKYCPPERKDVLKNRCIRFTQAADLNDIYEMSSVVSTNVDRESATRARFPKPKAPFVPTSQEKAQQRVDETVASTVLALSLSSDWNIIPMWSHYASSHSGFVIGFRAKADFFKGVRPVDYMSELVHSEAPSPNWGDIIFRKYEQWSVEREWRCVRLAGSGQPADEPCTVLDAEQPRWLFCFPEDAVAEVVLGHRMDPVDRKAVMNIVAQYGQTKVFQAEPDSKGFALRRVEAADIPFRAMEDDLLQAFHLQLLAQCKFVSIAKDQIDDGLRRKDTPAVFCAIQSLLVSAANIARALWGGQGSNRQLRATLRTSLDVDGDSAINERLTSLNCERFDEQIDEWWRLTVPKQFIDLDIGPKELFTERGYVLSDAFRFHDPATGHLKFWRQEFELTSIVNEVTRIRIRLEELGNQWG